MILLFYWIPITTYQVDFELGLRLKTTSDLGYVQDNKIYIAESLTELNKKLFNRCLNVRREKAYQFLWTSNGRIYMRKDKDSRTNIIASPNDLLKLP